MFWGCFGGVLRVCWGCFGGVLGVFWGVLGVLWGFAPRARPISLNSAITKGAYASGFRV